MVDANHILRHLRPYGPMAFTRRRPEAEKQLALADRIIVNKASATRRVQLSAACRSPLRSAPLPSHSFHHGPSGSFHPVPSRSIHLPSRSIPNTSLSIMFRPIPSHPLPFRPRPVPFHPVPFHPVPSHSVPFDPVPCHTMPIPYPCHTHTTPTPHPHHTILYHTIPCRRTPSCKVDLTDADVLADVTAAVRVVNGSAAILTATKASVPLGELLGLHAFSSDEFQKRLAPQVDADGITSGVGTHGAGVRPGVQPGLEAAAGDGVSCVCIRTTSDVELPKLEAWLQKLVQKKHEDIFRIKGVIAISGKPERFVLHGVHAQVLGTFDRDWREGERESTLVVIGIRLMRSVLEKGFLQTTTDGAVFHPPLHPPLHPPFQLPHRPPFNPPLHPPPHPPPSHPAPLCGEATDFTSDEISDECEGTTKLHAD
eukprot:CAMPEP_0181175460 /NCGR_PEP_ID=MMETSP1096-20121128/4091_1 /TAXON_ID=156174 ORGANISM="Chrysochromulina ericina, Strain CCMP281" /NCGR_SAMPLE_ID=MMETSP1096 /ASSEMBLY_ACC=CAM_ASM_000453 /LENGTH=424 /DNA_ID=CAMNT_0023263449 /DNA_START=63 /DNA_END=1337 /DNA_ORIENTATION=-